MYVNGATDGEDLEFQQHFSFANFIKYSEVDRKLHTYTKCKECLANHRDKYLLFRKNKCSQSSNEHATARRKSPDRRARIGELLHQTPESLANKTDCVNLGKDIAHHFDAMVS